MPIDVPKPAVCRGKLTNPMAWYLDGGGGGGGGVSITTVRQMINEHTDQIVSISASALIITGKRSHNEPVFESAKKKNCGVCKPHQEQRRL